MKKIVKRLSLLMALLMLLSAVTLLGSCKKSNDTDDTESTTVSTVTPGEGEINYRGYLPEATFDGKEIIIYTTYEQIDQLRLDPDKPDRSNFDRAIYARNVEIEEKYDVVLDWAWETTHDRNKYATVCNQAGAYEYDIMAAAYWWGLEQQGGYVNLLDYDVLNFENPYWVTYWNQSATVNDKCFTALGYWSMTPVSKSCVVYYNKQIVKDMQFDDPAALVESGDWTLANMKELMIKNTFEVDGDGVSTYSDSYGLGYNLWSGRAFLWGAGLKLSNFDNNEVEFTLRTAHNTDVFDAVYSFLKDGGYAYYRGNDDLKYDIATDNDIGLFTNGRSLFFSHNLLYAENIATSGKLKDYGVLPMPKLDTNQEDYITPITGGINFAIFMQSPDIEAAATIMEAMCILSYCDVLPVYYEDTLKLRYQTDAEAAEMIDLIRSKINVDFLFINDAQFNNVCNAPFDLIAKGDTNFEGEMQSRLAQMPTLLEKFMQVYTATE